MRRQEPQLDGPKRQHFLPSSYLNGFTKSGKLAVYDRESDDVRIQTPINTAVIRHFYTMVDEEGRNRYEVESMLSDYESRGIEVIRKLMEWKQIDSGERNDLSTLIALFVGRVPYFVNLIKKMHSDMAGKLAKSMFSDIETVKEDLEINDGKLRSSEDYYHEAKNMVEFISSGSYKINTNHKWAMGLDVQSTLELAPIFAKRNWTVLHQIDSRTSFVTTDIPVFLATEQPRNPSIFGVGFADSDAVSVLPIAHSCALMMSGWGGQLDHSPMLSNKIRDLNLSLACRCERFIIGRDRELVKFLANQIPR